MWSTAPHTGSKPAPFFSSPAPRQVVVAVASGGIREQQAALPPLWAGPLSSGPLPVAVCVMLALGKLKPLFLCTEERLPTPKLQVQN